MINGLPIIRLELEEMRHQVVHALMTHHTEMERLVDDALVEVIRSYDFRSEVLRHAQLELRVKLKQRVAESIARILVNDKVERAIDRAITDALKGAILE